VDFRLLGPVEVRAGRDVVELGPAKQRCVLAALAVQAGRPVPTELVVERVWGTDPPGDVRNALYSYITRLRRAGVRISRTDKGYLLDTAPDLVDLHRFTPATGLDRALREWRGEPLDGLSGDWVERVRAGLHRKRIGMLAAWADAALAEGRAADVVERIGTALDDYPHAESLIIALLRGLHAEGRTAEALQHYELCRARLRADVGVTPGSALREVHARLLRGGPAPIAKPAQLPAPPHGFVGRAEQLRELDAVRGGAVVISGGPGVGKTALALTWAHRVAHRFPDGLLHADLGGSVCGVPQGFLRALGVAAEDVPHDPDAAAALYRSLLAGRRVLVLLDNAADAGRFRPLLPEQPGCLVVITRREQLGELAREIPLRPLSLAEAVDVLAERLGPNRIAADRAGAAALAEACGRLPLALRVAAATLLDRPDHALAAYARELCDGFSDPMLQYAIDRAG
jgi:DNA-binding SARP family transcriptional activator